MLIYRTTRDAGDFTPTYDATLSDAHESARALAKDRPFLIDTLRIELLEVATTKDAILQLLTDVSGAEAMRYIKVVKAWGLRRPRLGLIEREPDPR